jgi:hypothetical protein
VGEIITTWTMLRFLMEEERRRSKPDIAADMRNRDLSFISVLPDKMHDEIVARLSELATAKNRETDLLFCGYQVKRSYRRGALVPAIHQRHRF